MPIILPILGAEFNAPAFLNIGTPGAKTVISATGWSTAEKIVKGSTKCHGMASFVRLSNDKDVIVFRRLSDQKIVAGVITKGADGSITTEGTVNDLSTEFTSEALMPLDAVRMDDTRICIAAGTDTATRIIQVSTYTLSGDTLTLVGAAQTKNTSVDAAGNGFLNFSLTKYDSNTVVVSYADNANTKAGTTAFKVNVTQAVGAHTAGTTGKASGNGGTGIGWLGALNNDSIYIWSEHSRIDRYTVTPATPVTTLQADLLGSNIEPSDSFVVPSSQMKPIQAEKPVEDGRCVIPVGTGYAYFSGKTTKTINTSYPAAGTVDEINVHTLGLKKVVERMFVEVDRPSDSWVRGIEFFQLVSTGPATTGMGLTSMIMCPVNVNANTGAVLMDTLNVVEDTGFTWPVAQTMGAFYESRGPHINVYCEDTAAAPSRWEVPITG